MIKILISTNATLVPEILHNIGLASIHHIDMIIVTMAIMHHNHNRIATISSNVNGAFESGLLLMAPKLI